MKKHIKYVQCNRTLHRKMSRALTNFFQYMLYFEFLFNKKIKLYFNKFFSTKNKSYFILFHYFPYMQFLFKYQNCVLPTSVIFACLEPMSPTLA